MKGNGGIIGSDNTPTTDAASGVWGLRQIFNAVSDEIWPEEQDLTGFYSSRFISQQTTGDSTYSYANITSNSDFDLTGDYTVELWYKPKVEKPGTNMFYSRGYGEPNGIIMWVTGNNGSVSLSHREYNSSGSSNTQSQSITLTLDQWYHFAFTRSGNTVRLFFDGSEVKSFSTTANATYNADVKIGQLGTPTPFAGELDGFFADYHIVNGTALYTSSFTPPTSPIQPVTNTVLLAFNSSDPTANDQSKTINTTLITTTDTESPYN